MTKLNEIRALVRDLDNITFEEALRLLKMIQVLSRPQLCICSPYEPGVIFNPDPECPMHGRVKDW